MRISFSGNHLYKFQNRETVTDFCKKYHEYKLKSKEDMIIYGYKNYVHVIDGQDVKDFRAAQRMNTGLVKEPFLFVGLTKAYRETAKIVDFHKSNMFDE